MKLYTTQLSPNPRRVEIYLREKAIGDIERVTVDLMAGEHRTPAFRRKNPLGLLPVLELDDGRVLTESVAICEYLEELHPSPPLIGTDSWQRACTREAVRIAELGVLASAMTAFQHTQPFFAERVAQSQEAAAWAQERFTTYLERIESLLDRRTWLAGDLFTVADITLVCAIDFGRLCGCDVPAPWPHIHRWLDAIRSRPSCQLRRPPSP